MKEPRVWNRPKNPPPPPKSQPYPPGVDMNMFASRVRCRFCGEVNCMGYGCLRMCGCKFDETTQTLTPAEDCDMHGIKMPSNGRWITDAELKAYCDQARAYGFEVGRVCTLANRRELLKPVYESTPMNPFIDPEWDTDLQVPQGFQLTYRDGPL